MATSAEAQKVFYLNDLWLHLCWSSSEMMPVFPAHRMLSQAKYMALLRWLMVRQSLSTLSERCMALLAASSASTLFPRRSTVGHKQSISLGPSPLGLEDKLRTGCLTHTFWSGSCGLPADWRFYGAQPPSRPSAECSPAGCRHTGQPCQSRTHMFIRLVIKNWGKSNNGRLMCPLMVQD